MKGNEGSGRVRLLPAFGTKGVASNGSKSRRMPDEELEVDEVGKAGTGNEFVSLFDGVMVELEDA